MDASMLPVLHLRRQAAVHGWRRARRIMGDSRRLRRYKRFDEDGGHFAWIDPGFVPGPGEDWSRYRSPSLYIASSDGEMRVDHVGGRQAVRLIRALFGWPEYEADERMALWPPRSTALVPLSVYAGGVR